MVKFKGIKDIRYLFNEEDESAHEHIRYLFNEPPFKSIITDIRSNLSKRGHKLIKNGLNYAEVMKDLTCSQVKSFKEKLFKFNNDLIKKIKLRNILIVIMKNIKFKLSKMSNIYLMTLYMKILNACLMNQTEIKSYEAKPYEVRSNEIKSYEIDYIDIKRHKIKFYGVKSNQIKSYEAKPYEVKYYDVISDEIKSYEIDYTDIRPYEIKSYKPISNDIESNETEFNKDYCIENIKNEFNKLSNNLV